MKFISKKEVKYFLWDLYKILIYSKNFVPINLLMRKVGKLPTLGYLAITPKSKENKLSVTIREVDQVYKEKLLQPIY